MAPAFGVSLVSLMTAALLASLVGLVATALSVTGMHLITGYLRGSGSSSPRVRFHKMLAYSSAYPFGWNVTNAEQQVPKQAEER